ncbi:hypothetical protein AcV5_009871 [Taiwanofungus camphoratus]|nr:hypothetical protein AcV5_009871 [Antrodia cinnamomea]
MLRDADTQPSDQPSPQALYKRASPCFLQQTKTNGNESLDHPAPTSNSHPRERGDCSRARRETRHPPSDPARAGPWAVDAAASTSGSCRASRGRKRECQRALTGAAGKWRPRRVQQRARVATHPPTHPSVCLSVRPSVRPSIRPSVHPRRRRKRKHKGRPSHPRSRSRSRSRGAGPRVRHGSQHALCLSPQGGGPDEGEGARVELSSHKPQALSHTPQASSLKPPASSLQPQALSLKPRASSLEPQGAPAGRRSAATVPDVACGARGRRERRGRGQKRTDGRAQNGRQGTEIERAGNGTGSRE